MWGSAFAVYITQSSLTGQFEHSGKVRMGPIGKKCSLLSGSAAFPLCCADEFTKNETVCCPQIEHFRSYSCSSWALSCEVAPLLFALRRAHWLVSWSTLARYVRAWLDNFIFTANMCSLISSVLRWWVHKEGNSILSAGCVDRKLDSTLVRHVSDSRKG